MIYCSFYSDNYSKYYNYCVKSLEDNNIKYDIIKVHQSDVKYTSTVQPKYSNKLTGFDIKIDNLINMIKKYMGQTICIFDITTIFLKKPTFKQTHDMLFAKEFDSNNNNDRGVNLGLISVNCNENTLHFFEMVKNYINEYGLWDQGIVNVLLGVGKDMPSYADHCRIIQKCPNVPSWDFLDTKHVYIVNERLNYDTEVLKFIGSDFNKMNNIKKLMNDNVV